MVVLGLGEGDEVIVPTFTYIAPVNAITYTGAKPVFVDSLDDTWQMDPADVRRKISPRTKAILCVHVYGHPCEMDQLQQIAEEHGVFLVEDCAEAIGSTYKGRHVGSFGDIATFSFYGNKTITTGEGGMVVTNDETLYARSVHYKGQGLAKYRQYWHDVIGYNYRMTNICAAIGLAQLEQVDTILQKKRRIATWYRQGLSGTAIALHGEHGDLYHSYWMCTILTPSAEARDPLREHLARAGVETRPTFFPVHTMPMYAGKYERHRVAESLGWRGMNLPSYPDLQNEDVDYITNQIKAFSQ